jgi:hypothetical protein
MAIPYDAASFMLSRPADVIDKKRIHAALVGIGSKGGCSVFEDESCAVLVRHCAPDARSGSLPAWVIEFTSQPDVIVTNVISCNI